MSNERKIPVGSYKPTSKEPYNQAQYFRPAFPGLSYTPGPMPHHSPQYPLPHQHPPMSQNFQYLPPSTSTSPPLRKLLLNETVIVNLQARGWVMGIIVGVLRAFDTLAGWHYTVRYIQPGEGPQEGSFPHDANYIRPSSR